MKYSIGTKLNMSRIFTEEGRAVAVTAVQVGPCVVTDVKTQERDGYSAVQIGYGTKKHPTKAAQGHSKKSGGVVYRHIKEFRVENIDPAVIGKTITAAAFEKGDVLTVVGTSKGRGFQGVVKRHGFGGSPASHGHKDQLRMPGSIGATDPARVFKGTRMGGQMGNKQVTVKDLKVEAVDSEAQILYVRGAVPGAYGSTVFLRGDGELVFTEATATPSDAADTQSIDDVAENADTTVTQEMSVESETTDTTKDSVSESDNSQDQSETDDAAATEENKQQS